MPKFTSQFITDLKPATNRYSRSDRGLAIEVLPTGTKTWCCWIKKAKQTIGKFPSMSLKEARTEHQKLLVAAETTTVQRKVITLAEFIAGPYATRAIPLMKRGDDTRKRIDCLYGEMYKSLWNMKLNKIGRSDVDKILAEMVNEGRKPGTVKRDIGMLKAVFNRAVEWEYLPRSPATDAKPPKTDRYGTKLCLTDAELERLSKALEQWKASGQSFDYGFALKEHGGRGFFGNPNPVWYYYFIKVSLNTGMRLNEVLTLVWGDIDFDTRHIIVRGDNAKSGNTRRIPISKKLMSDLKDHYRDSHTEDTETPTGYGGELIEPDPDEAVWPITSSPRKPFERLRKMAKLDKTFTMHILRHSFASTLVRRGVPINQVQKLLGHADITTTQIYLTVFEDELAEAVDLL